MNDFEEMLAILAADRSIETLMIISDELEMRGFTKEAARIRVNRVRPSIPDEYFLTRCEGWLMILSQELHDAKRERD